jgi:protein SCO1
MVCALLPLISYFIIKKYTDNTVKMPRHYFYDAVIEDTVNGKKRSDTIWHTVKNLRMVNQFGDTVQLDDLKNTANPIEKSEHQENKILLVNFFFTHCPTICPKITSNLINVQKAIANDSSLHMISISLDPKRDSVQTLRKYANQYGIKHDNWWFCRLIDDTLENVMLKEFKAGFQDAKDSSIQIVHSPDVYLLDKKRQVRGKAFVPEYIEEGTETSRFYSGLNKADLLQLMQDAEMVKMEKTEKAKPPFAILVASMVLMGCVFIWMMWMKKRKKKVLSI